MGRDVDSHDAFGCKDGQERLDEPVLDPCRVAGLCLQHQAHSLALAVAEDGRADVDVSVAVYKDQS